MLIPRLRGFEIWAVINRFLFIPIDGLIDLGKYHRIIRLGSVAFDSVYLFWGEVLL